jgi:hypothetical protein
MGMEIICTEHNVEIPVTSSEIHGGQVVHRGFCERERGHEVEVVEW